MHRATVGLPISGHAATDRRNPAGNGKFPPLYASKVKKNTLIKKSIQLSTSWSEKSQNSWVRLCSIDSWKKPYHSLCLLVFVWCASRTGSAYFAASLPLIEWCSNSHHTCQQVFNCWFSYSNHWRTFLWIMLIHDILCEPNYSLNLRIKIETAREGCVKRHCR